MLQPVKRKRAVYKQPEVVRTLDATMRALDDEEWIGLDLETSGLSPWNDKIATIQLYGEKSNTAAVLHVLGNIPPEMTAWLGSPRHKFIAHNGTTFDILFLERAGVNVYQPQWYDTLLGETATLKVGRNRAHRSLKESVARRLSKEIDKTQQLSTWMSPTLTDEQVHYCVEDVRYLPGLRRAQLKEAGEDQRIRAVQLEHAILPVVVRMSANGLPLNLAARDVYLQRQRQARQRHDASLLQLVGHHVNYRSPAQVKRALHEMGLDVTSTDAETLQRLSLFHDGPIGEFATHTLSHRQADKRLSMLSDEWVAQYAIDHDEESSQRKKRGILRVHSRFNQCATETGRFSSSDPNLQQVPKDGRMIYGGLLGHKIVSCDFSQIEVRIAAALAEDVTLIELFNKTKEDGGDIHTMIASQVFGVSPSAVTKEQRRLSKAMSFTLLFGGGPKLLYNYSRLNGASITLSEAKEIVFQFFSQFSGLYDMRTAAEKIASTQPAVPIDLPSGMRRTLAGAELTPTRILNTTVQGTAAVGLKRALIKCHERGLSEYLCATVHDELVSVVPDSEAEDYAVELQRAMIDGMVEVVPNVPIAAEYTIGEFWS